MIILGPNSAALWYSSKISPMKYQYLLKIGSKLEIFAANRLVEKYSVYMENIGNNSEILLANMAPILAKCKHPKFAGTFHVNIDNFHQNIVNIYNIDPILFCYYSAISSAVFSEEFLYKV